MADKLEVGIRYKIILEDYLENRVAIDLFYLGDTEVEGQTIHSFADREDGRTINSLTLTKDESELVKGVLHLSERDKLLSVFVSGQEEYSELTKKLADIGI